MTRQNLRGKRDYDRGLGKLDDRGRGRGEVDGLMRDW